MNGIRGKKSVVVRTVAGMLVVLLLDGCVTPGVEETILPTRIDYACGEGRLLRVARSADGRAVVLVDGQEVVLQQMASAAQEKYGDGRYVLYLEGERAMLELDSKVLLGPCVATVPLPSAPRYR